MANYDHIIIGSGINALVCAALLSRRTRVLVLEREDVIGGTVRTDELAPGFTYDPLATTFLLFQAGPAFTALGEALAAEGVAFAATGKPTGVLMSDGRSLVLGRDRAANIAAFDAVLAGEGERFQADMADVETNAELLFGLFNNAIWTFGTASLLARHAVKRGPRALMGFFGRALISDRRRLATRYRSDLAQALFAPWPLHAGLNPDQPFSGQMGALMGFALEAIGAPVVVGGAAQLTGALRAIIERAGSTVRTGADADRILPGTDGRDVKGIALAGGEEIDAPSVICSVTPQQLYGRLLRDWTQPKGTPDAVARYGYGKGNLQIHYALERPIAWSDPALGDVQLLHLCDGVDAVSKASNEAERGMLPERPVVCIGQPTAADPSRAPDGKAVAWIQIPQAPRTLKGDAAGTIDVPDDGSWTEAVREAFADRVEVMIAAHAADFRGSIISRKVISPADLAVMNVNLVDGDPYGGWCGLDQFFLFRPLPDQVNHKTFVNNVYHIGASTHPGPGLHGTSGYLLARKLAPRGGLS